MKQGKKYYSNDVQASMFGMDVMNISQGVYGTTSHGCRLALDLAGKDTGKDQFYASFDGTITYKEPSGAKTLVIFSSVGEVLTPVGLRKVNIELYHDNDIQDLWKGKFIQQGEAFYQEGTAGQASGNHIHMMCSFGDYDGSYPLEKTKCGNWAIKNQVHPQDVFFIDDTVLKKDMGYNWRKLPSEPIPQPTELKVGDLVKIVGDKYATGQNVPSLIKLRTHTIKSIKDNKALLKEIVSWVYLKDLKGV